MKSKPILTTGKLAHFDRERIPANGSSAHFADVEQAAFSPADLVPGICPSPDKMLRGRLFYFGDTHCYRLGANHGRSQVERTDLIKRRTKQWETNPQLA
jgi:catalase